MWVAYLTETAGGPSKFGSLIQRGLRVLRQSFQGRTEPTKVPIGEPKFHDVSSKAAPILRSSIKNSIREAWKSQFSTNQTSALVSRMRQRYEFRLASGFRLWNGNFRGLAQTVARYGFVGVGVAGGSQWKSSLSPNLLSKNMDGVLGQGKDHFVPTEKWNLMEDFEYVSLLAMAHHATSCNFQQIDNESTTTEESDITILNEEIEENDDDTCFDYTDESSDSRVENLLDQFGQLDQKQKLDLFLILQEYMTCENSENDQIQITEAKGGLTILENDLNESLNIIEFQNRQLWDIHEVVLRQNLTLKLLQSHPVHHVCYEKISADLEPDITGNSNMENSDDSFEIISYGDRLVLKNGDNLVNRSADVEEVTWLTGMQWDPGEV